MGFKGNQDCRRWLAGDSGGSAGLPATERPLSQASQLPQLGAGGAGIPATQRHSGETATSERRLLLKSQPHSRSPLWEPSSPSEAAKAVCQPQKDRQCRRLRRLATARRLPQSGRATIDRPAQRHQPFHQLLRINRLRVVHYSFPRITDPPTIAATHQTRESGGYLFG
jgi:hypothetical protein